MKDLVILLTILVIMYMAAPLLGVLMTIVAFDTMFERDY